MQSKCINTESTIELMENKYCFNESSRVQLNDNFRELIDENNNDLSS